MQFGAAGSTKAFVAYISRVNAGNDIQLRLDSITGSNIADITITSTGGNTTEAAETAAISSAGVYGLRKVFVYFDGSANRSTGLNGGGMNFGNISYFEVK